LNFVPSCDGVFVLRSFSRSVVVVVSWLAGWLDVENVRRFFHYFTGAVCHLLIIMCCCDIDTRKRFYQNASGTGMFSLWGKERWMDGMDGMDGWMNDEVIPWSIDEHKGGTILAEFLIPCRKFFDDSP